MELENVFKEPSVLGFPLSNCYISLLVVIIFLEVNVPPGVLETT
jgi:hypothetical protein